MIKSLRETELKSLLDVELKNLNHAYLFYSKDSLLNNDIAELFAYMIFCETHTPCFECPACKKTEINKNPDFTILDKSAIAVDDILQLLDNAQLKPMLYDYKVILIKNAENINEVAQNKLLKTLEEPNNSTIFILTTTNEEKLLATVKSRLKIIYLNLNSISPIRQELLNLGVNEKFLSADFTLSEMVENSQNKDYLQLLSNMENCLLNLKTTQNIPACVNGLKLDSKNKFIYLDLLNKAFNVMNGNSIFSDNLTNYLRQNFSVKLTIKIQELIQEAYKRLKSNVNANYTFDCLFYMILKEKYLCKQ